jgi:hypothetical protein
MKTEVSPLPTAAAVAGEHVLEDLKKARREATEAILAAEEADKKARAARKQANWKVKIYERMVAEYNGQLKLPVE